ncbi:MAG: Asp-tRNA(Asn)/Glu-tRNA(Gln) amidotransferase subunit GatA [Erysipelotrichaceae bacterium]|nr:Asp-tRNA(Asn)/Glu-tRNA(Gln) amidotransferase subunit GatA [Erysipelotrichaceae bacterium]
MTIVEMLKDKEHIEERVYEALEKAKKSQKDLNAVVTFIDPKEQLEHLCEVKGGLLEGVPVILKDNVSTKGIKTTASSKILENYVPIYDATIVKKMRDAGAIFIAKSSMDELAMGGTNLTAATGPVRNPHNLECMSGGSSGGSAALVAAGVVPMAIGSDTGDSIRKPASYCGVVGLKPTYGRISRYGIIPYSSSLDHVGCFTRSVKDAAIALEVLAGRDDFDMTSSFEPVEHYIDAVKGDVSGKKVAVLKNVIDAIDNEATMQCFNDVLDGLRAKGAIVEMVEMNEALLKALLPAYYLIANCEATANHSNLDGIRFGNRKDAESSEEIMIKSRTEGFGPLIRKRFVIGSYGLFVENQEKLFRQAQRVRRLIVEEVNRVLSEYDVFVAPASVSGAPKLDDASRDQLSDTYLVAENHMILGNFTGYPSITVPMGLSDGMPVGICLTVHAFKEGELLNIAQAVEDVTGLCGMKVGD